MDNIVVVSVEALEHPQLGLQQYYKISLSCGHYEKRPGHLPEIGQITNCPQCYFEGRKEILTCPLCKKAGVERNTEEEGNRHIHLEDNKKRGQQPVAAGMCPECGSTLWNTGGSTFCQSCGFEKCS